MTSCIYDCRNLRSARLQVHDLSQIMQQLRVGVTVVTNPFVSPCYCGHGTALPARLLSQSYRFRAVQFPIEHSLRSPLGNSRWQRLSSTRAMQREEPGPGQESVWDYPRPPRLEPVPERITVELGGKVWYVRAMYKADASFTILASAILSRLFCILCICRVSLITLLV